MAAVDEVPYFDTRFDCKNCLQEAIILNFVLVKVDTLLFGCNHKFEPF